MISLIISCKKKQKIISIYRKKIINKEIDFMCLFEKDINLQTKLTLSNGFFQLKCAISFFAKNKVKHKKAKSFIQTSYYIN